MQGINVEFKNTPLNTEMFTNHMQQSNFKQTMAPVFLVINDWV